MKTVEIYKIIKGKVTADDVLNSLNKKGVTDSRGGIYSIHMVRSILAGRSEDEEVHTIVLDYLNKLKKIELV